MDCWKQNAAILEKERPKLLEKLEEIEYDFDKYSCVETRDGNRALCVEKEGKQYRFNSVYRPIQEAQKWADQYEYQNMNIVAIMYGLGNGVFLQEMLSHLDKDAKVFVYEPDVSLFRFSLENFPLEKILEDGRIQIFVGKINTEEFEGQLSGSVHWTNLPSQIVCHHPMYDKIYMEDYAEFLTVIENVNKLSKVNRDTEAHMAHMAVVNTIQNLPYIKESNYVPDFVEDIPEEVPAIIVAAGPSLDKNIEELKKAKGKAFILATDTSVKYLLAHNVPFDAIITIDARKSPVHLQDERCNEIPIFCNVEAKNLFLQQNRARKIWFRSEPYTYALYEEFGRKFPPYNSGGSVATGAFSACVALGFTKIVLVGQDLAYDGETTHAGGVEKHIVNEGYGIKMVEGINGEKVKSRYDWLIYKKWFEDAIEALPQLEVIDATEGGALIQGTKVMKLSEVIEQNCKKEFDFAHILEEKKPTFSSEEYEKVKNKILHLEKEFTMLQTKSREGKKAQKELTQLIYKKSATPQKEEKCLKIIRKANNVIQKQSAYKLLDSYIAGTTTDAVQQINMLSDDADANMLQTLSISGAVYDALIAAVEELMPVLQETFLKL